MATCDRCGATRPEDASSAMTWTTSLERGRQRHFCESCARTHLRSIEARLDSTDW